MQTLKNTKKSLAQSRVPRVSTRGYYDLGTGAALKKKRYDLCPKNLFDYLGRHSEFTLVVHGMRNNRSGALSKFRIVRERLLHLGYLHPVIGFSYDSNVRNAHLRSHELDSYKVGKMIARKNGWHLSRLILDFKKAYPGTRIRLMGHSLGSEVVLHAILHLEQKPGIVESAHFFGSSISSRALDDKKIRRAVRIAVRSEMVNYYSRHDEVLRHSHEQKLVPSPLGYAGYHGSAMPKYRQKKVRPENHRFASYMAVLTGYPRI